MSTTHKRPSQVLDFARLRERNQARQAVWPGAGEIDELYRAVEVGEEAGEVLGAVKKLTRAKRGIAGSTLHLEDVADEAGDVVIALDLLCAALGIDLAAAVAAKFNKTSRKYNLPVFIDPLAECTAAITATMDSEDRGAEFQECGCVSCRAKLAK